MLHVFCKLCIEQVVDTVTAADDKLADMEDIDVDVSSSKINAALKEMLRIRRDQPGDKLIVDMHTLMMLCYQWSITFSDFILQPAPFSSLNALSSQHLQCE